MRAYYGSRISENQTVTPEGYLICLNVPIARTGIQQYLRSELGLDGDPNELVDVMRTEDEVFSNATIASFEGKTVTEDHPPTGVNADNVTAYDCGHAQNVRRGTGEESDLLIADLFITSKCLIDAIQKGRREVSCGYDCEYVQDESGHVYQRSIRGNHVAVVPAGRAGARVAIKDSDPESKTNNERGKTNMANKKNSLMARLFSHAVKDMAPEEISDAVEEMSAASSASADEPAAPATPPAPSNDESAAKDGGEVLQQVLAAINGLGEQLKAYFAQRDNQPAADPLDALVEAINNQKTDTPADQEGSVTVPAETIPKDGEPEDGTSDEEAPIADPSTLPENPIPGADRAIVLATINAIKPVIAALPENQRKAASDKAAFEIRKMLGKDAKPATNGYAGILGTMKQTAKNRAKDSAPKVDDGKLGRDIMASRNPHYKKA
ncbi:MAG: DUF2213 domain-containing protein [Clostridia bacterium]|nr:DUF2213 domain-containing protein [Clostridia bacterium]